jgi:hypothetical protein
VHEEQLGRRVSLSGQFLTGRWKEGAGVDAVGLWDSNGSQAVQPPLGEAEAAAADIRTPSQGISLS